MTIQSMTGFARVTTQAAWGSAQWEIRSVNHRFLELAFRLPESVRSLEMPLRDVGKTHLRRGKVDGFLRLQLTQFTEGQLVINQGLVDQLKTTLSALGNTIPNHAPINLLEFMQWPGVLQVSENELTEVKKAVTDLFMAGLEQLSAVRQREGEKLAHYILERILHLEGSVLNIEQRAPELMSELRHKLRTRIQEVTSTFDNARLEQELAVQAQRIDVGEELSRLKAHCGEVKRLLQAEEAQGRSLDFLLQELQREVNTLAAKCNDITVSKMAVEMKVMVDQMREQVQNIE